MLTAIPVKAQELSLAWKFQTEDRVISPPLVEEDKVYFGGEDGNFYALNAANGTKLWSYPTRGRIQGGAAIHGDAIFFESGNIIFSLNKNTGKELWRYDPKWALWGYKIDPYDDKRSKPVVHEGRLYIGSSLGFIFVLDISTGKLVQRIAAEYQQPIRTTPLLLGNRLFYGDWAGKVYAYSLEQEKPMWMQRTYEKKPYETFGGIASELILHQGKLIFGARNPNFKVLDAVNGQTAWQYTDSTGGWIIGDPVIDEGVLYIGGSDNRKMFAFNPENGELIWSQKVGMNIYTKPIVTDRHLMFTIGNAYNHKAPGKLVVLNKKDGTLHAEYEVPEATFSSPAWDGQKLYFGAYDGNLYALNFR